MSRVRQSSNNAWPATAEHRRHLVHHAARNAGRGVFGRLRDRGRSRARDVRKPPTSPAVIATATAKAALDDKPDPTGTVDVTSASKPITARSGLGSHPKHRGDRPAPRGSTIRASS